MIKEKRTINKDKNYKVYLTAFYKLYESLSCDHLNKIRTREKYDPKFYIVFNYLQKIQQKIDSDSFNFIDEFKINPFFETTMSYYLLLEVEPDMVIKGQTVQEHLDNTKTKIANEIEKFVDKKGFNFSF